MQSEIIASIKSEKTTTERIKFFIQDVGSAKFCIQLAVLYMIGYK